MRKYFDQIARIAGNVVTVEAEGVGYDELAVVTTRDKTSLAQVIHLEGNRVSLQVFSGTKGLSTAATVRFLNHPMQVGFTDQLLGRIFSGSGVPMDNKPAIEDAPQIDIAGPSVNPVKRIVPS